jgi:hypothetical protein
MSTKLVVDSANKLKELNDPESFRQSYIIRLAARIISYVFHPVFVPVYIIAFLQYITPMLFAGISDIDKKMVIPRAALIYTFFPVVTVLLLRALQFINSIYLETQRDRIIPYVVCNIWYFWAWFVCRGLPYYPKELVVLSAAIFLASCIGLMANIYIKISMHSISMGVATAFMMMMAFDQSTGWGLYVVITLLITGLVLTSRFIISNHSSKEIYGGLLAGIAALIVAALTRGILY